MHINTVKRLIDLGYNQTDTLRFITPILGQFELTGDSIVTPEFKGAYIDFEENRDTNKLLLKYTPNRTPEFKALDKQITSLPLYFKDSDKGEDIVYEITLDSSYKDLLNKFYKGKYSEFDDSFKKDIIEFWGLSDEDNDDHISGILYKTDKGKLAYDEFFTEDQRNSTADNELWPVPDMEHESL